MTGVDRTEKLDTMRALGADHVIDFTEEDFTKNGRRYDMIFDVKTTRSVVAYQRALRPGGTYATVGGKTSRLLQLMVFRKMPGKHNIHLVGYKANKDSNYLVELFEAGRLVPVIDKCFPLEETADAFRYFGQGRFKGKVIVIPIPVDSIKKSEEAFPDRRSPEPSNGEHHSFPAAIHRRSIDARS